MTLSRRDLLLGSLALATTRPLDGRTSRLDMPTSGTLDPSLEGFDRTIREFVAEHEIPGMSIAVTDQGRLVLTRGYGFADVEKGEPVEPTSLFRIASISKSVTAVAVMRLVDAGKLSLETPMLELLDLDEEIRDAGASFDERQRQITVAMLLEHRGGWDRDQSFDPMFRSVRFARRARRPPPADTGSIIAAMLRHPLDFAPGERYAYSNYGYCLLGRIIERVAGESYESFVRREVLEPIGIRQMRLGRTRLAERAAGEVRYHHPGEGRSVFAEDLDQPCPHPYGAWYLEAMDAHGGWIASGVDLLRLAVAIDDPDRSPLLSRSSLERMSARPDGLAGHDEQGKPRDVWYALGWQVRDVGEGKFNRWHSGSLPGTLSILIRRSDGRNFAALLNTRHSPKTESLGGEVDRLMHRAAAEVETWPEIDRFGDPEFAAE